MNKLITRNSHVKIKIAFHLVLHFIFTVQSPFHFLTNYSFQIISRTFSWAMNKTRHSRTIQSTFTIGEHFRYLWIFTPC